MDVGEPRGPLHGLPGRRGAGVGDVEVDGVVEQHRVLGNDADGRPQARLGDVADILAAHQDPPAGHVEEAVEEPPERGLARPARPDHRHLGPGPDLEVDPAQDGAIGLVGEVHRLEAHAARAHHQAGGPGPVPDLRHPAQEPHQQVHVGKRILDLAVDDPEVVEGDEELEQEGVDQHQVPEGHRARHHTLRGEDHQQCHADGDDGGLAEVERRHRGLALDRRVLPAREGAVVAADLVALVAEVLDRLVVDQAVHGLRVGLGLEAVHLVAEVHPPVGDGEGEPGVDQHGHQGDQGEDEVVAGEQDRRHEPELHQRRQHVEDHVVEERADAAGAPLQVPEDGAGLALQVEAQGEVQQVREHPVREPAHGAVADLGEDRVAQLVEEGRRHLERAVGRQQGHRQHEPRVPAGVEGVDDRLEDQRNAHVGDLREQQRGEREQHPAPVLPDVGQHRPHVPEVVPVLVGLFGVAGGGVPAGDHGPLVYAGLTV